MSWQYILVAWYVMPPPIGKPVWDQKMKRRVDGFLCVTAICLAFTAMPPPARGQTEQRLSDADSAMMDAAVAKLNQRATQEGDSEAWANPKTGSSGTVTLKHMYPAGLIPCHSLAYDYEVGQNGSSRSYEIDWCKTATGWQQR
jgi:hypothetical protein